MRLLKNNLIYLKWNFWGEIQPKHVFEFLWDSSFFSALTAKKLNVTEQLSW